MKYRTIYTGTDYGKDLVKKYLAKGYKIILEKDNVTVLKYN
jgi:hypothetical protein